MEKCRVEFPAGSSPRRPLIIQRHATAGGGERKSSYLSTKSPVSPRRSRGKSGVFSAGRDKTPRCLQQNVCSFRCLCWAAATERLCRQPSRSLALYGVEQRKWPWLLPGWPAAPQPSTSTSCTYMAWPKNEITTVVSHGILRPPPSSEEVTETGRAALQGPHN